MSATDDDTEDDGELASRAEVRAHLTTEFRRLRLAGWTLRQIGDEFGRCPTTVSNYIGTGYKRHRTKLHPEQETEVRRLRRGGMKLVSLARRFGVSVALIGRICKGVQSDRKRAKITPEQAREIREEVAKGVKQEDVSKRFGLCQSTVSLICSGKLWPHAGGPTVCKGVGT